MPELEADDRYQKAVLWPAESKNRYGNVVVGSPREIMVRWEYEKREMIDPQGKTVMVDATVVVGEDVTPGSELWLGALDDWPGTGLGDTVGGTMRVVAFSKIPDLKGRSMRPVCGVQRSRDEPSR